MEESQLPVVVALKVTPELNICVWKTCYVGSCESTDKREESYSIGGIDSHQGNHCTMKNFAGMKENIVKLPWKLKLIQRVRMTSWCLVRNISGSATCQTWTACWADRKFHFYFQSLESTSHPVQALSWMRRLVSKWGQIALLLANLHEGLMGRRTTTKQGCHPPNL